MLAHWKNETSRRRQDSIRRKEIDGKVIGKELGQSTSCRSVITAAGEESREQVSQNKTHDLSRERFSVIDDLTALLISISVSPLAHFNSLLTGCPVE